MSTLKTYEVIYVAGVVNPMEYSIKINSIVNITSSFIKDEIERTRPNHKGQILTIFNPLLIDEKELTDFNFQNK